MFYSLNFFLYFVFYPHKATHLAAPHHEATHRAESIENRAVGLSPPVRHLVMKLPDYGRGRTLSCGEPPPRGSSASPRTATSPPRGLLALPLRTPSLAHLYEATHRYRRDFCTPLCCRASILARRAEIRSTLRNAGFVFLRNKSHGFLICATCRRSCGLAASPRAATKALRGKGGGEGEGASLLAPVGYQPCGEPPRCGSTAPLRTATSPPARA